MGLLPLEPPRVQPGRVLGVAPGCGLEGAWQGRGRVLLLLLGIADGPAAAMPGGMRLLLSSTEFDPLATRSPRRVPGIRWPTAAVGRHDAV